MRTILVSVIIFALLACVAPASEISGGDGSNDMAGDGCCDDDLGDRFGDDGGEQSLNGGTDYGRRSYVPGSARSYDNGGGYDSRDAWGRSPTDPDYSGGSNTRDTSCGNENC